VSGTCVVGKLVEIVLETVFTRLGVGSACAELGAILLPSADFVGMGANPGTVGVCIGC